MKFYGYHYNDFRRSEEDAKLYKEYLVAKDRQELLGRYNQTDSLDDLDTVIREEEYAVKVEGEE